MKNVWVVNQYINVPGDCGSLRHYSLAKYLQNYDYKCTLITSSVEHSRNKQRVNKNKFKNLNNVKILWLKTFKWSRGKNILRVFGMIEFMLKIIFFLPFMNIEKPDVIVGTSPNLFAAFGAAIISLFYKVPFVLEIRDLWPESLVQLKAFRKKSIFYLILKKIEAFLLFNAKKIIVVFEGGIEYYKSMGVKDSKLFYLPNGIDMKDRFYKIKETINSPFQLFYLGSIGYPNAVDKIIKSFHELNLQGFNKDKIVLSVYGDGPLKKKMIELSSKLGVDNVVFKKAIPNIDLLKECDNADGFIFAMLDLPKIYNHGISFNKIFEYLSLSKPIVYNSYSSFNPIVFSKAGIESKSLSEKDFAEAIKYLINLPIDERNHLTKRGFEYVLKNHSYDYLAFKLEKILSDLTRNKTLSKSIIF